MPQTPTLFDDLISQNGHTDSVDSDEFKHVNRLGWVPTDWKVKRLDKLADLSRGKFTARPRNDPKYYGGDIPFVQTGDVANAGGWLTSFSQTLNEQGLEVSKVFPEGTILVTIAANIGSAALATFDVAFPDSVVGLQPSEKTSGVWLLYAMQKRKARLEHFAAQSAQKNINLRVLRPQKFATPPPGEQQRIADILKKWDRAIEQVDALIEKKQERLHGLRQRLVTGDKRLPEFDAPWEKVKLGEVFKERDETGHGDLDLLAVTMEDGVIPRNQLDRRDTSSSDKSNYLRAAPGDLVYNSMRMWQGVSGIAPEEGIVSPAYTVCTPQSKLSARFVRHLFQHESIINLFRRYSQGLTSDTLKLRYEHFAQIEVEIPPLEEQRQIAKVLDTAEAEIETLEKKRDALKRQKKGLMQRLLTGAVRTV